MKALSNEKESSRFTSRPAGCFFKILYFAQASDWRFHGSSLSGVLVAVFISFERVQGMSYFGGTLNLQGATHLEREETILLEILERQKNGKCNGGDRRIVLPRLELDLDLRGARRQLLSEPVTDMLREVMDLE